MTYKTVEKRREYSREYYRNWRRANPQQYLLNSAKRRAKERGLEFNLAKEDIIIPDKCPIFGVPLEMGDARSKWNSPSLDRKDNDKGYIKGNVAVISMKANLCKSDLSPEQIKALYNYVFELA